MRLRSILALLALFALGCSSSNTTEPPTNVPFEGNFMVSFYGHPEDTIQVTGQGPAYLQFELTSNGKPVSVPSSGISMYYYDPIRGEFTSTQKYVGFWDRTVYQRDTSFYVDFRVNVLGTIVGPIRKYFNVRLHVATPSTFLTFKPVDDHSYEIMWHRETSDDETDTLEIRTTDGIEYYTIHAPDSNFLYTKAESSRYDTVGLRTLGGLGRNVIVAAPYFVSQVYRLYNYLGPKLTVGLHIAAPGIQTLNATSIDSAEILVDPNRPDTIRLSSAGRVNGIGPTTQYTALRTGSIDTASPNFKDPLVYSLAVDTASMTPMYSTITWRSGLKNHGGLLEVEPQSNGRLIGNDQKGDFIEIRLKLLP